MDKIIEFDLGSESGLIRQPLEDFAGLTNYEIESALWSEYGHRKLNYADVGRSVAWICYFLEVTNGL